MPVPEPRPDEGEDDFISRCISTMHDTDPERPDDQIIAICFTAWRGSGETTVLPDGSGFFVVDIETPKSGPEILADLKERIGEEFDLTTPFFFGPYAYIPEATWLDKTEAIGELIKYLDTVVMPDGSEIPVFFVDDIEAEIVEIMHPDFIQIRAKYRAAYGKEKGDSEFQQWVNEYSLDTQDSWENQKHKTESIIEKKAISLRDLHADFQRILGNFRNFWGKTIGADRFLKWLDAHTLDPHKAYSIAAQAECHEAYCEAFRWLKPAIQYLRHDDGGRYWKVVALTANTSLNDNDYEDSKQLARSAPTLEWSPLDLNHVHGALDIEGRTGMLPFPDNRVDLAAFEDNAAECIIRISNEQKEIQEWLDDGTIIHVSIEGQPRGVTGTEKGRAPLYYSFTALGLLTKRESLPGDPVTFLEPLMLDEAMSRGLVESLRERDPKEKKKVEPKKEATSVRLPIDGCGQCAFFKELSYRTTQMPLATSPTETTDATVTTRKGGLGRGAGICLVLERAKRPSLVRTSDPACSDAKTRDDVTSVVDLGDGPDRTVEGIMSEIELKAKEAEFNRRIADLEEKILDEQKKTGEQRMAKLEAQKKLVELQEQIAASKKTEASDGSKITRQAKEIDELRDDVEALKDKKGSLELDLSRSAKDVEYYKVEYQKTDESLTKTRTELTIEKGRASRAVEGQNDASEKRATAIQRAQNAEADKARVLEENAQTIEELSKARSTVSDLSLRLNDSAKQALKDNTTINELRAEKAQLVDDVRELKGKIEDLKKRPREIRVKL